MGTWGPGIFSDDFACDVREQFRELIGDGLSAEEATEKLMTQFKIAAADPETSTVFWLALAATQWNCGRLLDSVKQRAISIIDSGENLQIWTDPKQAKKRSASLGELRKTLESPPPEPRKIAKVFYDNCDWPTGSLVSYQLKSGKYIVFRVIGLQKQKAGRASTPVCELLDWCGESIPDIEHLKALPIKRSGVYTQMMIGRLKENHLPAARVKLLGVTVPPEQKMGSFVVLLWKTLDASLEKAFGLT